MVRRGYTDPKVIDLVGRYSSDTIKLANEIADKEKRGHMTHILGQQAIYVDLLAVKYGHDPELILSALSFIQEAREL